MSRHSWNFLDHDALAHLRKLRSEGQLDAAESILLRGEPSPAVLDELRKIASARARAATRAGDWNAVVRHLESYNEYAQKWRDYCWQMVHQEPPAHTASDLKLLENAKLKLRTSQV